MTINHVDLQRRLFERVIAAPDGMGEVSASTHYDIMTQSMILKLRTYVWAEHLGTIEVPATWWQHFKQANFPKWLLRRYPVKMKIYDANELYPNLSLKDQKSVTRIFLRPEPTVSEWGSP